MNTKALTKKIGLIIILLCNNNSMQANNELPVLGIIAAIFGLSALGIHEYSSYCQKCNDVQLLNNVQDFIASIIDNHKVELQLIIHENQTISEQTLHNLAKITNKYDAEQYYHNLASYKEKLNHYKHALRSNIDQWSEQNNKAVIVNNARSYLQEIADLEKQLSILQTVVYEHLDFFKSLKLNTMIAEKYKNELELYYQYKSNKLSHTDFTKRLTETILLDAHQSNIAFPYLAIRDALNQDLPIMKKTEKNLKQKASLNRYPFALESYQRLERYFEALSYIHEQLAKSPELNEEAIRKINLDQQRIAIQANKELAEAQKEQARQIKKQTEELKRKNDIAHRQHIEDQRKNDYNAEAARQNAIFEPERQNLKRTINQLFIEIEQLKAELLKQITNQKNIDDLDILKKRLIQLEVNIIQLCQNKSGENLINAIKAEFIAIRKSTNINESKINEKTEVESVECSICLDHVAQDNDYFKTACKHVFHKHCLREYKSKAGVNFCCPLCRGSITNLN